MEAGREDFGLRTIFTAHGKNVPFGKRAAAIDSKELTQIPIRYAHE